MEKAIVMLKMSGRDVTITLPDDLQISKGTIDSDLEKHSALFAYWGEICAELDREKESLDSQYKQGRASADCEIRRNAEESKSKLTEERVKNLVEVDPLCVELKKKLETATYQTQLAHAIKDAFWHRKDCIVTLAANMRMEAEIIGHLKEKRK